MQSHAYAFRLLTTCLRPASAVLLTAAVLLTFAAAPAFAAATCQEAAVWVEAQGDTLPQTIEAFADVPEDYRAAAFRALPLERQTELWSQHIEQVITNHPELADADRVELRASAEFFERPQDFEAQSAENLLGIALGGFVGRLMSHDPGTLEGVVPVALPTCNCDPSNPGCARVWCIPTQGCSPYDCAGLWSNP